MKHLTENQQIVYNTVCDLIKEEGVNPTLKNVQERLAETLSVSSLNSIVQYLKSLEKKGYIMREKNKRGGIYLPESVDTIDGVNITVGLFDIPILGLANCGDPCAYAEQAYDGTVKVSQRLLPSQNADGVFMVKVTGDSMNKRGLKEGDYAIIKHMDYASAIQNGDIVLAIVNGLATIKTIFQTIDNVVLRPESTNQKHQPIFLHPEDNFYINGKLVGVFKNS